MIDKDMFFKCKWMKRIIFEGNANITSFFGSRNISFYKNDILDEYLLTSSSSIIFEIMYRNT